MTLEQFLKLRKGDKVNLRLAGRWTPCRVTSQHGPEAYRVVYVSPIAFVSRFPLTTDDISRLRQPETSAPAVIAETPSLFTSE